MLKFQSFCTQSSAQVKLNIKFSIKYWNNGGCGDVFCSISDFQADDPRSNKSQVAGHELT